MDNQNINLINLVKKAIEWKKPLILFTSISVVLSIIIAFFIAPQYKSTAIIFPIRQFSVSKLLIEQNNGNQEDYMEIGDEDDAEKVIQVLNSESLKLLVADRFNLWQRWSISKDLYAPHNLRLKWDNMIKIKRTDFNSIKIEAYDYTANGAANICNSILNYCDTVRRDMTKAMADKALSIVKEEFDNTVARMNELEDSLQILRGLGVLDYKSDVEAYTKSYAKALEKGNSAGVKLLEEKLNNLKKYGGAYLHVSENLRKYRFKYPVIKSKYDDALVNQKKSLPFMFVMEKGTPDEFKARPIKSLIVIITFLSTFILTFICLLFKESLSGSFFGAKKKITKPISKVEIIEKEIKQEIKKPNEKLKDAEPEPKKEIIKDHEITEEPKQEIKKEIKNDTFNLKQNKMKEFNKTEDIFVEIWSHRYKIAILLFSVALVTGLCTYLITPKYKSTSIVFPVNLYPTSDESTTEQLMQYFNSNDIKMDLAKKHHLFEYYGIDTTKEKGGRALFDYMYKENITISPTLYESIEITVKDHDPLKAQELNAAILALTNNLVKNNKKYILYQYINNINRTINLQNRSIDSVMTLAKGDDVFVEGDDKEAQKKNKKVKKLKQKEYGEKIKGISKSYGRILYKRDKFYMDYAGDLTFFSLVSNPTISDKRCYPVRSMFIITAEISTLILCLVIILIRFRIRMRNVQTK